MNQYFLAPPFMRPMLLMVSQPLRTTCKRAEGTELRQKDRTNYDGLSEDRFREMQTARWSPRKVHNIHICPIITLLVKKKEGDVNIPTNDFCISAFC